MANAITPIRSTTQVFLEIEDIKNDLLMLTDGSCALVIETTAVNFSLLSEKEQEAMIFAYSGLLNSLSFPIQIYIRSKRKDISGYVDKLQTAQNQQKEPAIANRIKQYREFITNTVKERNVLDKKFYIVIPFSALELGVTNMGSLMGKKGLPYPKNYILDRAKTVLTPKRDHIIRQMARLGLKGVQLNNERLIRLFHEMYNPDSPVKLNNSQNYTQAVVSQ